MASPLVFRCPRCGAFNRLALLQPGRTAVCGKCKTDLDTSGTTNQVSLAALYSALASCPVPVLLDCWEPTCAPCRAFAPILERFAHEQAGRFIVLKLDTQANPAAGARLGIQAVPTLIVFREGQEVQRVSGALPLEELRRFAATAAVSIPS